MFYYTYILKSSKDDKMYVGWTPNLRERLIKHNSGLVISTSERRPLELIYYEACTNKQNAIKREKYFKSGFGRKFLKDRV